VYVHTYHLLGIVVFVTFFQVANSIWFVTLLAAHFLFNKCVSVCVCVCDIWPLVCIITRGPEKQMGLWVTGQWIIGSTIFVGSSWAMGHCVLWYLHWCKLGAQVVWNFWQRVYSCQTDWVSLPDQRLLIRSDQGQMFRPGSISGVA